MKRITYWPQAWLGVAINFSIIYSWILTAPTTNLSALWTMFAAMWSYVPYIHLTRLILKGLRVTSWTMVYGKQ